MQENILKSIEHHFDALEDPRAEERVDHKLIDILVITICAVVGGANDWEEVVVFGEAKEEWFREFLELTHGIPSYSTFWRFYRFLDAEQFESCFARWMAAVCQLSEGEVVAIDGKQCRRSHDRTIGQDAICLVSAWASANGITLGQVKTDAKSNEITTIPLLLEMLDLQNCIITIDAMGCQTHVAEQIVDEGGDYVLALKMNQGTLHEDVVELFDDMDLCPEAYTFDTATTVDKGHGRIDVRHSWIVTDPQVLNNFRTTDRWTGLQSIVKVQSERYLLPTNETSVEVRYFISSLNTDARTMLDTIRTHWHIENRLHWVIDVSFREDESRLRKDHGAQNFAILRRLAHNLLKKESSRSDSIKSKRARTGWDNHYLLKVLASLFA